MCPVKEVLERIGDGTLDLAPLTVSYDNLHPFWGGLVLTIHGTGQTEQRAVRHPEAQLKSIAREDLLKLVRHLVRVEAWVQRVPERAPVPDESKAQVSIRYGNDQTTIWEWHNDLNKNQRIIQIRDLMLEISSILPDVSI